jgi:protein-S-isoprenylcysteine O-methyltransferase Ste14
VEELIINKLIIVMPVFCPQQAGTRFIALSPAMQLSFGQKLFKRFTDNLKIFLSITGFVPGHATLPRILLVAVVLFATIYFSRNYYGNQEFALAYFLTTTAIYMGFIYTVLPEQGLRLWFIKTYGDKNAYLVYEAILGAIFFLQGAGMGYLCSSFPLQSELSAPTESLLRGIGILFILTGFSIKVWATKVVSVDIYYWKDMFLGRRIRDFVVRGPYSHFKNPMYGIGHLQVYGTALFYLSWHGLLIAVINQLLIFTFYFFQEKKFIQRVYISGAPPNASA